MHKLEFINDSIMIFGHYFYKMPFVLKFISYTSFDRLYTLGVFSRIRLCCVPLSAKRKRDGDRRSPKRILRVPLNKLIEK